MTVSVITKESAEKLNSKIDEEMKRSNQISEMMDLLKKLKEGQERLETGLQDVYEILDQNEFVNPNKRSKPYNVIISYLGTDVDKEHLMTFANIAAGKIDGTPIGREEKRFRHKLILWIESNWSSISRKLGEIIEEYESKYSEKEQKRKSSKRSN